jgi:VIT1/CCC1 family predicted Fe2+/Mn2+ transporter
MSGSAGWYAFAMPTAPHIEKHFTASETVRDIVIGMSDGLTVPFALAAGLSGAVESTRVVVTAGLAEIAAGAIAMGLGGFLAARTDQQHYDAELAREKQEVREVPAKEKQEVADILTSYGLTAQQAAPVVEALAADEQRWVDFMMKFELGLEPVAPQRARNSALTIAASYIGGGLIPLAPYMIEPNPGRAVLWSIAVTLLALAVFGAVKARFTGIHVVRGGMQTAVIGGIAAGAAYGIAKLVS